MKLTQKWITVFGLISCLLAGQSAEAKTWFEKNRNGFQNPPFQDEDSSESSSESESPSSESSGSSEERKLVPRTRIASKLLRPANLRKALATEDNAARYDLPDSREENALPMINENGSLERPRAKKPEPERDQKPQKTYRRRAFASLDSNSANDATLVNESTPPKTRRRRTRSATPESLFRASLLGGYTPLVTNISGSASSGGVAYLGVNADWQMNYFGVEAEGYYGSGSTGNVSSINQMGGLANVKGQIPFRTGRMKWIPKLGVGYGFMGENQTDTAGKLTRTTIGGVALVAGLEFLPLTWLTLSADFARSLSVAAAEDRGEGVVELDQSAFQRIRVSAQFKVSTHFYVGANFTTRSAAFTDIQTVNQICAMVGVQF